jgi:hypothetical protein
MTRIIETLPTGLVVIIGVIYPDLYYNVPQWALNFCLIVAGVFVLIVFLALAVLLDNLLLRKMAAWGFRSLGRIFRNRDFADMAEHIDQVLKQFGASLRSITGWP